MTDDDPSILPQSSGLWENRLSSPADFSEKGDSVMKKNKMLWTIVLSVVLSALITFIATFLIVRKLYLPRKVTVNSNGMAVNDHYTVNLHCFSSDIANSEVILPVTVTVTDVSVNEHNQIEVKIYPNPATDYVQVSSEVIDRVEIHNMLGQKVFDGFYGDSHVVVSTDGMAPGTYVVTVTSNGTQITKQVVVK